MRPQRRLLADVALMRGTLRRGSNSERLGTAYLAKPKPFDREDGTPPALAVGFPGTCRTLFAILVTVMGLRSEHDHIGWR
jgi:hypothetical protein